MDINFEYLNFSMYECWILDNNNSFENDQINRDDKINNKYETFYLYIRIRTHTEYVLMKC